MNNWIMKQDIKVEFRAFRLDADLESIQSLGSILIKFKISTDAEKVLRLEKKRTKKENNEAYQIDISQDEIIVKSPSFDGLYYGLSSLKLLLFINNNKLPIGIIADEPKFKNRGVFLDVSRGKLPKMDYLKDLVVFLSDLKYNILQLYFEDKFSLASDPNIGLLTGSYSANDIKELDEWCKKHKVQLQPCLQTYSHLHGILNLPEYSDLAENENLFSLAAGNEKVYEFLERIFSQVLKWFSSTTVHINMDEAYDLGTGYTKEAVEKHGKGFVYLEHIRRVAAIAEKYGAKEVIIWGDVALKYKEYLNSLPKNIIIADWNYNPLTEFKSLEILQNFSGRFWTAGGVSTWNSLFPRVYNSYVNLINYSKKSLAAGSQGFLVTDWGDYGHFQPSGLSLYGYMLGAEQSYNANLINSEYFENVAWPFIFIDERVSKGFKLLMDSNLAPSLQTDFKTMSIYYLFDDLFDGLAMNGNESYGCLTKCTYEILYTKGLEALHLFDEVLENYDLAQHRFIDESWERLLGKTFIEELYFSAKSIVYTGKKGLLSIKIKESLQSEQLKPSDLLGFIMEIKQLYIEFLEIRNDFEKIWEKRAHRIGIENSLLIFDKAGVQLGHAVSWLSAQYREMKTNNYVDRYMETYTQGKEYKILWTADYKNMWDKAYPWQ